MWLVDAYQHTPDRGRKSSHFVCAVVVATFTSSSQTVTAWSMAIALDAMYTTPFASFGDLASLPPRRRWKMWSFVTFRTWKWSANESSEHLEAKAICKMHACGTGRQTSWNSRNFRWQDVLLVKPSCLEVRWNKLLQGYFEASQKELRSRTPFALTLSI